MNMNCSKPQERDAERVPIPGMTGQDKIIEALKSQKKFDVVYADPPWDVNQKGRYGAINHYGLMPLRDIMAMPVGEMTKDDAVLFLWIVGGPAGRKAGERVMEAWGFECKADFDWIKPRMPDNITSAIHTLPLSRPTSSISSRWNWNDEADMVRSSAEKTY